MAQLEVAANDKARNKARLAALQEVCVMMIQ